MRIIRKISALILGFTFFIAGFLKIMDPVGAGLVVSEYLKFLHLGFLRFASEFIGVAAALAEAFVGAAIITGVWRKVTAFVSLCLLGAFTLLTLALLIFNPAMDCGCFGEIVHLSHAQSFIKNIILLALWALAFIPFKAAEPTRKVKYISFAISSASMCLFLVFSLFSIPLVDFTDLKQGTEIMASDYSDYSAAADGLSISDKNGEYADSVVLEGKVIAISIYNAERISDKKWQRIEELANNSLKAGFTPVIITSSTASQFEQSAEEVPSILQHSYFADRRKILTLNRSNGGATYIAYGQIVAKWSSHNLPDTAKLQEISSEVPTEILASESGKGQIKTQAFLLYVFAVMLLM